MQDIEKIGCFYLGKVFDPKIKSVKNKPLFYESKNFTTHAVCVGMTGSGKTGLGVDLLEEAALSGVPAIIIDPKGDLGNLLLTFPNLQASEFLPWIDSAEAARKGCFPEQYAEKVATTWKEGLALWGLSEERIKKLKSSIDMAIYTPASKAGIPLSILNSFTAPPPEFIQDSEAMRDRVLSTTSSLLGLLNIDADPINSREHILISTIIDSAWRDQINLDVPQLIREIQKPPFDKLGVFDIDTFFPQKERMVLSMKLNNLLASPGFQAWMEGEPLDIQNLLYTKEGKPRLAILTIAHLSDSERMFFVTLLLNELLTWMRRQTGTSSLRALLYMDEIFGYFPPTAMPPSKLPMLTLLKQARAFGLGIVLATQNPVDLDYKGLSNCGTWFIGKLQTERDKARVIEGLNVASNGDMNTAAINQMIASCGNRVFILRSVYLQEPILFQTRWTMSYLRGPLTLPQIQLLMSDRVKIESNSKMESSFEQMKKQEGTISVAPIGIQQFFVYPRNLVGSLTYQPKILGVGKLHFVDAKRNVDFWRENAIVAPIPDRNGDISWDKGEDVTSVISLFEKIPPANASFQELPAALMQEKSFSLFNKSFAEFLYQNQTFDVYEAKDEKMTSKSGETKTDFRQRVAVILRGKLDVEIKKIRDKYASKIKILQDKIQRYKGKTELQKSQVFRQKMDTFISIGTTLLGTLFGRGISKGSITQAGTTMRKAGRISKEQEEVAQSEESLGSLQKQLQDLQSEMENEVAQILGSADVNKINVETTSIRPRKSDIAIEMIAIVWCPVIPP